MEGYEVKQDIISHGEIHSESLQRKSSVEGQNRNFFQRALSI